MTEAGPSVTRLLCATDRCSTLVHWPTEVNRRLDQLQELATNAGTHVSRAQILAALVMAVEESGETVAELVRVYRLMEAGNPASPTDGRRPGPRKIR